MCPSHTVLLRGTFSAATVLGSKEAAGVICLARMTKPLFRLVQQEYLLLASSIEPWLL